MHGLQRANPRSSRKHFGIESKALGKTAFVLAGGGSFGALQVGMLRALLEHGLVPDLIVGSSVGAINGAYLAGAATPAGIENLTRLWLQVRRQDIFGVGLLSAARFFLRRDFLVSADGLRALIDQHLPYRRLEDARIPVHIIATDFLTGEAVVLSRGSAADAILASSAIPVAFAPVMVEGRYLVDGAVTSNTPVSIAARLGATRIIVLPTGFACALAHPPRGAIANALHALTLLIARQLVAELESLDAAIAFAVVPTPCPREGSPYDFSNAAAMIETGGRICRDWIAGGGLEERSIPGSLRAHGHEH